MWNFRQSRNFRKLNLFRVLGRISKVIAKSNFDRKTCRNFGAYCSGIPSVLSFSFPINGVYYCREEEEIWSRREREIGGGGGGGKE